LPLVTDNILEARSAYSALETRATSAETLAAALKANLDQLSARLPLSFELAQKIRQRAVDREADNAQLQRKTEEAVQATADIPLPNFIAALGLAAAVGEATMPDRAIPSMFVTVQSHIVILPDSSIGLRFFQPGVTGDPGSLSGTSLEIARIPPRSGENVPRSLYAVLEDKQSVFTATSWSQFGIASQPPEQPARDIVVAISVVLANTGSWSFPYLLKSAAVIAGFEKTLSTLLSAALPGDISSAFASAVASLESLTEALAAKAVPVIGDFLALTESMDATTRIVRSLAS
jgi:hypothetical protein